jgi:exodeoxyribonuclease V alpha subunit
MPQWGRSIRDFAFARLIEGDDTPDHAAEMIRDLVADRLPRAYDLEPGEIQVLCPMNGGAAGTRRLNETLQEALNPATGKPELRSTGRVIRAGDRLIALRNNYQLEVFNGDLAVVERVNPVDHILQLRLDDGRRVAVPFHQADEFGHAFAISVHRAQGSEFRAVVMPLLTAHYLLLQRNLLYTAITRARELVVLVGQTRALAIAVKNDRSGHRYTAMARRLQSFQESMRGSIAPS